MASQVPEWDREPPRTYGDRGAVVVAIVGALLINAGIIGLFMLITWAAYATD